MNLNQLARESVDVVATGARHKLVIDGSPQMLPVYRIKVDLLRYNVQNDRIASWISRYKAEHGADVQHDHRKLYRRQQSRRHREDPAEY